MNDTNMAPVVKAIDPHVVNIYTCSEQTTLAIINNIESSVILYLANQSTDPQL